MSEMETTVNLPKSVMVL
jgi:hypothetical protein